MNNPSKTYATFALIPIKASFLITLILLLLQTSLIAHAETLSLDKPLVIRWMSDTQNTYVFSSNEKVFSLDESGNMVLISQTDGKIIWRVNQGANATARPVIDNGTIFIFTNITNNPSAKTTVRAINTDTGTTIWKLDLPDAVSDTYTSKENANLLCLLNNSSLIKISKKTGEVTNPYTLPENISGVKIINENLVIFFKNQILNAYHPASQKTAWAAEPRLEFSDITPIIQHDTLFIVTKNDQIAAINLTTGKTVWRKKVAKNIQYTFFANNSLMIATTENYLLSLSPQGKYRWKKLLDGRPSDNFLIFRDALLMFTVGSNNGIILNISKGKTLNRIPLEESEYVVAPPVATENFLFLQTQRGLKAYSNE